MNSLSPMCIPALNLPTFLVSNPTCLTTPKERTVTMQMIQENSAIVSPLREIVAYEALWASKHATVKTVAELFKNSKGAMPSQIASAIIVNEIKEELRSLLKNWNLDYPVNFLLSGTYDYPDRLKDAKYPAEALYYSGNLDLLRTKSIAIVGTRTPSAEGVQRAINVTKRLVADGFTIVSGLAEGIDTAVHKTAIEQGGKTIAVIGTPLNHFYPKANRPLQTYIAQQHLLVTQVPFWHYSKLHFLGQKVFFPERNKTMSVLTDATIIIEAGETSGTLVQARAALDQGRKLFILESCFHNPKISWPAKFQGEGAIRVKEYSDIIDNLCK